MLEQLSPASVTIIGLGLIGGSLGRSLVEDPAVSCVTGVDLNELTIDKAIRKKAIHRGTTDLVSGCSQADLVILATPISTIPGIVKIILPRLREGAVITDTGSTKQYVYDRIARLLCSPELRTRVTYAGCHPMAGSELSGIDAAHHGLFRGKPFVICPPVCSLPPCKEDACRATRLLAGVARAIGSVPMYMGSDEHDSICAFTSHLQHLIAMSLVDGLRAMSKEHPEATSMIAGSFKDATRVASSDTQMSGDLLMTNLPAVQEALCLLADRLSSITSLLESGDPDSVRSHLHAIKEFRDSLFHQGGIHRDGRNSSKGHSSKCCAVSPRRDRT